jgi:hypothetical protein
VVREQAGINPVTQLVGDVVKPTDHSVPEAGDKPD